MYRNWAGAESETINILIKTALYWGGTLLLHLLFYLWARSNTIDNLDKKELFE